MAEEPAAPTDARSPRTRGTRRRGSARHRSRPDQPAGPPLATRAAGRSARAGRRRRYAMEALAAFAGLLALVAFVGWWSEPARQEPPQPGGLPAVVGRPSLPSPVPTALAVPGLRPRERPPSPSPTPSVSPPSPAPVAVPTTLTVSRADIPETVHLTEAGRRDWMHWGLGGAEGTVRKREGTGELRDLGGPGDRSGWDGNQELFRWRDGAPVRSVEATSEGAYVCGTGNGFQLAVTADGRPRTATVYLGVWMARGRLDLRLAEGGPSRTVRLEERHTSRSAQVTIRFQAPEGTRLLLSWTVEETFTPHCGFVGLQAMALR
ncbi:hypothetical protein [Micromonospora sp. NPDC047134]|uniref:hypothetical protein n=1 Tax=Micromonospora sp. NPDC047134 TaxID=3154340 RepID=UPI0033FEBFC4